MATKTQVQPDGQPFSLKIFDQMMQAQMQSVGSPQAYSDGGQTVFTLPPAGLASFLMVHIQGTITVASTTLTAGTFAAAPHPAPFSILRNVTLGSSQNTQLFNLSLWSWYQWVCQRFGFDPYSETLGQYSALTNTLIGVGTPDIVPGATVVNKTYHVNFTLPIPIAYNRELLAGLLFLQNDATLYNLKFQWGNISGGIAPTGGSNDLFTGLVGTGITVTPAITTTVAIELIQIPNNYPPDTSLALSLSEQTFALNGGLNVIKPSGNNVFTMFGVEICNNGVFIDPASISGTEFRYSGNLVLFQQDIANQIAMSTWLTGKQPTDGMYWYDLGLRDGLPGQRDTFDAFDASQVTGLELRTVLPNNLVVTAPAQIKLITEQLIYVGQ